jgi:Mg2+/Co2+ transporter CorC
MLHLPEQTGTAAPGTNHTAPVDEVEAETHFSAFMGLEGLIRDIDRQADIVRLLQDVTKDTDLIDHATFQMIEMVQALRQRWDRSYNATSPLSGGKR